MMSVYLKFIRFIEFFCFEALQPIKNVVRKIKVMHLRKKIVIIIILFCFNIHKQQLQVSKQHFSNIKTIMFKI
jgi:branched-subunit amino acid transport protein AzlD